MKKVGRYESLFGASAFAEFLTYMASLREGSRGGEVTAMGGWQWGSGMALPAYAIPRLRFAVLGMTCWGAKKGWVPAYARMGPRRGDGDPRIREDNGSPWGWGFPFPHPSLRGRVLCGGMGMGPRPPPSRGQDLDARTTGGDGSGGRAVREPPVRKENIVGHGVHPHPPSSRGQALTFPHQGGRDL